MNGLRFPHMCAVQGTDARLSGHFTYSTTPAFLDLRLAPALRCTNRSEVQVGWLGWPASHWVLVGADWHPFCRRCSVEKLGINTHDAGPQVVQAGPP